MTPYVLAYLMALAMYPTPVVVMTWTAAYTAGSVAAWGVRKLLRNGQGVGQ